MRSSNLKRWQPLSGQFVMDNFEKGLRVKTRPSLLRTTGFIIHQKHIDARKPKKIGIVKRWVPGHGGDVWFVQHDDESIGAYRTDELGKTTQGNEMREVRYLTDDRDLKKRNELVIGYAGNGDWYLAVVPEGEGTVGRACRLSTSGGASSAVPGLCPAIAAAFDALVKSLGGFPPDG